LTKLKREKRLDIYFTIQGSKLNLYLGDEVLELEVLVEKII